MDSMVHLRAVHKSFGEVRALDNVSLDIETGSIFGLLGPNGAGKSTLINIVATLLKADSGDVVVAGLNAERFRGRIRRNIGLAGQYAGVDEVLTGRENLLMFAQLYGLRGKAAKARADEVVELLDLADFADRPVRGYSGGMRRRLDLGVTLVGEPALILLDEPTTGLDPRTRIDLWKFVSALAAGGTTILLTTQYLEEADVLCDSIAVIDRGEVIARGTAAELKTRLGTDVLDLRVASDEQIEAAARFLLSLHGDRVEVDRPARRLSVPAREGINSLLLAVRHLESERIAIDDIALRRPSLDDVFLTLTGRRADSAQAGVVV